MIRSDHNKRGIRHYLIICICIHTMHILKIFLIRMLHSNIPREILFKQSEDKSLLSLSTRIWQCTLCPHLLVSPIKGLCRTNKRKALQQNVSFSSPCVLVINSQQTRKSIRWCLLKAMGVFAAHVALSKESNNTMCNQKLVRFYYTKAAEDCPTHQGCYLTC